MSFDPRSIPEDTCAQGHLDQDPIPELLLSIQAQRSTGKLTIEDNIGAHHMFFMQGRPVSVQLAEYFHPLGQLLLELGYINGSTFVKAQRIIADGQRLPGQVYKEMGVLDDNSLKEVLAVQTRKKSEYFCRLQSKPFSFCVGLSFLNGFQATPLDMYVVVYLSMRQQMTTEQRAAWLQKYRTQEVRLRLPDAALKNQKSNRTDKSEKTDKPELLPAALSLYGFGTPEERFLQRLYSDWQPVPIMVDTGTLASEEAIVLLAYLEKIGRLDAHEIQLSFHDQPTEPAATLPAVLLGRRDRAPSFSSPSEPTQPTILPAPRFRSVVVDLPQHTGPSTPAPAAPAAHPANSARHPASAPLGAPVGIPSTPPRPKQPQVAASSLPSTNLSAHPTSDAPIVRKKKTRREVALPSEGVGFVSTETRKEKTVVQRLPSIMIAMDTDDGDHTEGDGEAEE